MTCRSDVHKQLARGEIEEEEEDEAEEKSHEHRD